MATALEGARRLRNEAEEEGSFEKAGQALYLYQQAIREASYAQKRAIILEQGVCYELKQKLEQEKKSVEATGDLRKRNRTESAIGTAPTPTATDKAYHDMHEGLRRTAPDSATNTASDPTSSLQVRDREPLGEKPSLAQLKVMRTASGEKIEIIKTVATRWRDVRILLDFDPEGDKVAEIEADHSRSGVRTCCQEMFRHWLSGGGTWATLIEVLEDEEYTHLAGQVRVALGVSD